MANDPVRRPSPRARSVGQHMVEIESLSRQEGTNGGADFPLVDEHERGFRMQPLGIAHDRHFAPAGHHVAHRLITIG